ncbi:MAG: phosphate ABC transporter substrate-binding protein PstS [Pseudomonadota bacterium]|nr:phosphate ABC transporter substrate-binding protein PstS [Pseudomonadota bacterium]
MLSRSGLKKAGLLATTAGIGLCLAAIAPAAAQTVNLLETGSSLLYPLFNLWVPAYTKAHPGLQITTQSTGSGAGISQAVSGLAQIGASDAYMSDALLKRNSEMLNIPLAISSQTVNYNLPGLNGSHLKLSGPVLAAIYEGKIKTWNDPEIAKLNPGTTLPSHAIITIHRTDGSGDTFIFTQFLSFSTPDWQNSLGYGTTISWPPAAPGAIGANGNQGMVSGLQGNPYSIAYVGISFQKAIADDKLGEAALQNRAGKFVQSTPETVQAAAAAKSADTPADERISLIFSPGENSYPIINYEYAIVKSRQANSQTAKQLQSFLTWCLSPNGGSAANFIQAVNFVPLPESVAKLSAGQVAKMQ